MIFFSLAQFDLVPIETIDKHQKCQQKYQLMIRYRFCELRMRPSAVLLPACVCLTLVWLRDAICTDPQLLTIAATAAAAIFAFAANSLARYIPIPQDSRQDHLNRRNEVAVYQKKNHFDQIRRQRDLRLDPGHSSPVLETPPSWRPHPPRPPRPLAPLPCDSPLSASKSPFIWWCADIFGV